MTLDAVAAATGLHATTISSIEVGRRLPPEPDDIRRLAEALQYQAGTAELAEFLRLAEEERSVRRLRRRKSGAPRRAVQVKPPSNGAALAEFFSVTPARPMKPPESFEDLEAGRAHLAIALKRLLSIDLSEGIETVLITTRTGNQHEIKVMPAKEGDHEQEHE
jgi:transcriptional regulator with XRE-family HTH domain